MLSFDKYLSSFSQILIHTRFNNYPTQTDIIGLASPQQLKSLNRDVKYRLKLIRNHYTTPETSGQTHVPRQQLNLDFPKALPTSLWPAFSYISCNSNPSSNHKAPRHSFFSIFLTRYTWQRKFQTVLSSAERSGTETLLTVVFKRLIWWYLTLISEKKSWCKLKQRERKLKNLNRGFLGLWIDSGAENFCIKDCVEPFGWNQFSFSSGKLINLLTVSHCFHFSSLLLYLFI